MFAKLCWVVAISGIFSIIQAYNKYTWTTTIVLYKSDLMK